MPRIPRPVLPRSETSWQARRPFARGEKLTLDDDGFADLGNAVLAAWLKEIPRRMRMWKLDREGGMRTGRRRPEEDQELIEAGERRELRNVLDNQGALSDAFAGQLRIDGDAVETFDDAYRRWEAALQSAEAFAVVAVKDVIFPREPELPFSLREALAALSPAERRMPIARLGPCRITRALRGLVLDYFHGERAPPISRPLQLSGPRKGSERAREKLAVKVLQDAYRADPDARLTKERAHEALAPHFPAEKARSRIWGLVEAPNWRPSGRPRNAQRWADGCLIAARLREALK